MVDYKQSATATTRSLESRLQDSVSVLDYGAVGDGVADDTAAIQTAIDDIKADSNGILYFPPNDLGQYYKITAPLTIDRPIKIIGAGPNSTLLIGVGMSAGEYILDFDCLAVDVVEHVKVEGLTLRSLDSVPNGMRIKNASYVHVSDVHLQSLDFGIVQDGTRTFSNMFEAVSASSITSNSFQFLAGFTGGGQHTFNGCTFTGDTGFSLSSTARAGNINFTGCNFEQCVTNSLFIGGICTGLSIVGCRTEGCNGTDFLIQPTTGSEYVQGLLVSGCTFSASDSGGTDRIILGGGSGVIRGFTITGNCVTHGSDAFSGDLVQLNGDGEAGTITGNMIRGTTGGVVSGTRPNVMTFGNENLSGAIAQSWEQADWGVEQGTWTPTDGSAGGLTLTGGGRYTKIGRMVFWQAVVIYPANADGSNAEVAGLPFAVGGLTGNAEGRAGGVINTTNHGGTLGVLQGLASANTNFAIYDATTTTNITNAGLSGKNFYASGMYSID